MFEIVSHDTDRSTDYATLSVMGELIGYARVSTSDQNPDLQLDALHKAECFRVFTDVASGSTSDRPHLAAALEDLRPGDTLVVWKLDRLGRSLRHLIDTVNALAEKGIGLRSLSEQIDTTTPVGRLTFHLFGALAEFERDLLRERTNAGLQAARSRGRKPGRKPIMTPAKIKTAKQMIAANELTVSEVASTLGVSRASVYRYV